jgi:hypothetical protein
MGGYRWSGNTVFTDLAVDGDTVIVDETNNRLGIGTETPTKTLDVDGEVLAKGQLEVNDTTTSSASTGGALRLSANDGAPMGDSHRLGVIEFTGAEDSSGTQVTGARIEAITDAAWTNVENGCALYFYTTDGNASQTNVLKLDSNQLATLSGDVKIAGDIVLDDGGSLKEAGGTAAITFDASGHVTKIGQDSMSSGDVLTWDGSKFVGEAPTVGDITGVTAGDGLSGGGTSGALSVALDLNELTAAAVDVANDSIAIIDAGSSNSSKKESIADLASAMAGSGITASSGVLALTESAVTITAGDGLKTGGSVALGAAVTVDVDVSDFAGTGLEDDGSENLRVTLNELGAAAVNVANDSIAIIDADDSNASKKESIADFVSAIAGSGLSASSGVLTASGGMSSFQLEDGAGTEVAVSDAKEVKFVEGDGIDITWTDTDNGTDGDPYDLTFTVTNSANQILHAQVFS